MGSHTPILHHSAGTRLGSRTSKILLPEGFSVEKLRNKRATFLPAVEMTFRHRKDKTTPTVDGWIVSDNVTDRQTLTHNLLTRTTTGPVVIYPKERRIGLSRRDIFHIMCVLAPMMRTYLLALPRLSCISIFTRKAESAKVAQYKFGSNALKCRTVEI